MHHNAVVLAGGQVLVLGGRQSPFCICSQILLLDMCILNNDDSSKSLSKEKSFSNYMPMELGSFDTKCDIDNIENCESRNEYVFPFHSDNCLLDHRDTLGSVLGNECESGGDDVVQSVSQPLTDCFSKANCLNVSALTIEHTETTHFDWGSLVCSVLHQSGNLPCPRWRHAATSVFLEGESENLYLLYFSMNVFVLT